MPGREHRMPKFVQHCVAAITNDPQRLAKVKQKGSPFAICIAQYKRNTRSLAAKHSVGKHHTVKDYEIALAKLREGRPPRTFRAIERATGRKPKAA